MLRSERIGWRGGHGLKNIDTKRCDGNYEGSGKDLKRGIAWKKCGLVRIGRGGGEKAAKKPASLFAERKRRIQP